MVPGQDSDVVVVTHDDGREEHIAVPAGTITDNNTPQEVADAAENAKMAITGPGLSDLLTEGNPADVMALPSTVDGARSLEQRIARLERGQSTYSMHDLQGTTGRGEPGTVRVVLGQRQMSRRDTGTRPNMDPFSGQGNLLMSDNHQPAAGYNSNAHQMA